MPSKKWVKLVQRAQQLALKPFWDWPLSVWHNALNTIAMINYNSREEDDLSNVCCPFGRHSNQIGCIQKPAIWNVLTRLLHAHHVDTLKGRLMNIILKYFWNRDMFNLYLTINNQKLNSLWGFQPQKTEFVIMGPI